MKLYKQIGAHEYVVYDPADESYTVLPDYLVPHLVPVADRMRMSQQAEQPAQPAPPVVRARLLKPNEYRRL